MVFMAAQKDELPFSARYSLPAQLAGTLGEVSWDSVAHLSLEFQLKAESKSIKVKKILKELQMTRLILMDRIRQGSHEGKIEPQLLVDIIRLLQRCEEVAQQYDLDLHEFSTFLYLISEKLKKEKLEFLPGHKHLTHVAPIREELEVFKRRGEASKKRGRRK